MSLVFAEQVGERAHRAALRQVSHHGDLQTVDRSNFFADRVKVKQSLGGMLARAVTGVDDGGFGDGSSTLRGPHLVMADDNHVRVAIENLDGVFQGFTLGHGGKLGGVFRGNDSPSQPVHGGFKGEARAGGGFVEERGHNALLKFQLCPRGPRRVPFPGQYRRDEEVTGGLNC